MSTEVWIVGASQGLGLAVAEHLSQRGVRVVGMSRREQPVAGVFDGWCKIDTTDASGVERSIAALYAEGRSPSSIVYMAATLYQGPLLATPDENLTAEVETNFLGFVRLCQSVARHKPRVQPVTVVATGSTLGYVGCASLNGYSASKAALLSFARSSRCELAEYGISVQIVSPPHIREGGADLVGPQPFHLRTVAPRYADLVLSGPDEYLIGFSNRVLVGLSRFARPWAQSIMDRIGTDALRRGARRC